MTESIKIDENENDYYLVFHDIVAANSTHSIEQWPQERFYPRTLKCTVTDMNQNPVDSDVSSVICGMKDKLRYGQVIDCRDYKAPKPVPFDAVCKLGQHMVVTVRNHYPEGIKVHFTFGGKTQL